MVTPSMLMIGDSGMGSDLVPDYDGDVTRRLSILFLSAFSFQYSPLISVGFRSGRRRRRASRDSVGGIPRRGKRGRLV
jgi:hypothetical protein